MSTTPLVVESPDIDARIEAEVARRVDAYRAELSAANSRMIQEELDQLRRSYKPPSPDEIRTLLSQEYLEFDVELAELGAPPDADGERNSRHFVIRELPQRVEKKFYKQLKDTILPHAKALGALNFQSLEGNVATKVQVLLDAFEPSFDILADAAVLCLNPAGEDKTITRDWVQNHLSSNRIWNVVEAQMTVNRLRDFFSRLFQSSGAGAATRSWAAATPTSPPAPAG